MSGSRQDYIAIAEYLAGTITKEAAARKLHVHSDFFEAYLDMLAEDATELEQELEDQMRKYGYVVSGDDSCVDRDYTGRRCI